MKRIFLSVLGIFMFLTLFAMTHVQAMEDKVYLRVLHASPDAPNVDVYIEKEKIFPEISYKFLSEYSSVRQGTYLVKIFPEGAIPKKEKPIIEDKIEINEAQAMTLIINGENDDFQLLTLTDDLVTDSKNAKVRFVHLSPDSGKLSVCINEEKLLEDINYNKETDYLNVKPDKKNVAIYISEQENPIYEIPNLEFISGSNYSMFALGLLKGEPSFNIIITKDLLTE